MSEAQHKAIGDLYALLYNLSDKEREAKVEELVNEAVAKIDKEKTRISKEATKEWLNELYAKSLGEGTLLQDSEDFIRWLDEVNKMGHQAYLYKCYTCNGEGSVYPLFALEDAPQKVKCRTCGGKGETEGPQYCSRDGSLHIDFIHAWYVCIKSF